MNIIEGGSGEAMNPHIGDVRRITKGVAQPLYRCQHCMRWLAAGSTPTVMPKDRPSLFGMRMHLYRIHGVGSRC